MLNFELSKLIDNIYKCGKSKILIKVGENFSDEIEIKTTPNGDFNISDEGLIQLICILYWETYLPPKSEKRKYNVEYKDDQKFDLENVNMIISLDLLTFLKYDIEIEILPEELNFENNSSSTIKLCGLIEKMLVNSKIIDKNLNISLFTIYESFKNALKDDPNLNAFDGINLDNMAEFFDKKIIPTIIKENLEFRKSLVTSIKMGEMTRQSISIIAGIEEIVDKNDIDVSKKQLFDLLKKFNYNSLPSEFRKNIDDYLKSTGLYKYLDEDNDNQKKI